MTEYFKNRDFVIIVMLFATGAALLFGGYQMLQRYTERGDAFRVVKAVCDYSHAITDGQAEEACARAQDASNAVYKCDSFASNAQCWVEEQ